MSEAIHGAETRRLPLEALHIENRAVTEVRNGWLVPANYGDAQHEYNVVRTGGTGLIDLSSRGLIEVSGKDAVQFLNGLVTNDIKALEAGQWFAAAFPNVQGRLVGMSRVLRIENSYLFDAEEVVAEKIFQTLARFVPAGDFKVADRSADLCHFSIQGAGSEAAVTAVLGSDVIPQGRDRVSSTAWSGTAVTVIRSTHTAEEGFDIFVATGSAENLWRALLKAGAEPVGHDALEIMRIEGGIPRHGVDVDESSVVLESGQNDVVSFTKGCYIGQEIIARIHWRGHVAKRLAGLMVETGAVNSGDKLVAGDGRDAGRITSTAYSPALGHQIALAVVKYDFLAGGTPLKVAEAEAEVRVAELPLVRGSWFAEN